MALPKKLSTISLIAVAAILSLFIGAGIGAAITQRNVPSRGRIKKFGLEVWWDAAATTVVESIDWGTLEPGQSVTRTVFIENIGNSPMTLSHSEQDFLPPEAAAYITLNWNYDGLPLAKNDIIPVDIIISIDATISGVDVFDFWITLTGDEI